MDLGAGGRWVRGGMCAQLLYAIYYDHVFANTRDDNGKYQTKTPIHFQKTNATDVKRNAPFRGGTSAGKSMKKNVCEKIDEWKY